MLFEFIGGALDKQEKHIDGLFEFFRFGSQLYYAKALQYKALGWTYVWYQYSGEYQSETV